DDLEVPVAELGDEVVELAPIERRRRLGLVLAARASELLRARASELAALLAVLVGDLFDAEDDVSVDVEDDRREVVSNAVDERVLDGHFSVLPLGARAAR